MRWAEGPWAASVIVKSCTRAWVGGTSCCSVTQGDFRRPLFLLVRAGRLDEEVVGAADRLLVAAVDLAVGEGLQGHLTHVQFQFARDFGGEVHRAAAAEDHHPLRVVVVDGGSHLWALLDHAHGLSSSRIRAALRAAYPSMFLCAFSLTASAPSGTSSLITAPAPV